MDALVIPADVSRPIKVIDLVAHRECDIWIHGKGRINGSPVNVRASHWVLNASEKAQQGRVGEWSVLYGDVVITGPPLGGEATKVSPALVEHFSSLDLSGNAVDDWTVRNVQWRVTDWPDMDRNRGDDGYGLGF